MTPEKAIEVLKQELDGRLICFPDELREAQKLGIEAMKRVQDMRISPCTTADELLPGETQEVT